MCNNILKVLLAALVVGALYHYHAKKFDEASFWIECATFTFLVYWKRTDGYEL